RMLFGEFRRRGYDVVPVTPNAQAVDGLPCFARVQDIAPPVEGALLLTTPPVTYAVVRDCAAAGIRRVWMHRGGGTGAVSPEAVEFCQSNGISVVGGECPYMFFPRTQLPHRIHGFLRRLFGGYPR
ncbi:MAG TPA: CoA-binding protein, partial [Candidatus Sulfopaludibacter sp.]|nr:CoA-binding protein [Candidatus Sulfopaludibacter sp.]